MSNLALDGKAGCRLLYGVEYIECFAASYVAGASLMQDYLATTRVLLRSLSR